MSSRRYSHSIFTFASLFAALNCGVALATSHCPVFSTSTLTAGDAPAWIIPDDLDGDGNQDLVVAEHYSGTVAIYFGAGDGSFPARVDVAVPHALSVATGDFNNDGEIDIVATQYSVGGDVLLLTNASNRSFTVTTILDTDQPWGITSADFDGDNQLDIAFSSIVADSVTILTNQANGSFISTGTYNAGAHPAVMHAGDMDDDGFPDLIVGAQLDNAVTVLWNDGFGTFSSSLSLPTGNYPVGIADADLDADGKIDLVIANQQSDDVSVFTNLGQRSFSTQQSYAVGDIPTLVAAADLDGDGMPDIVTANQGSNDVSVRLNQGGAFPNETRYPAGTGAFGVIAGDFDNDFDQDLAISNFGSDNLTLLLNQCQSTTTDGTLLVQSLNNPSVLKYSVASGSITGSAISDPELLNDGTDMAIGPDGYLYISISGRDRVSRYDYPCGSGQRLGTFVGGEPGSGPGSQSGQYLDGNGGFTFGSDGDLYIVSGHNYSINKYDGIAGGTVPLATRILGASINPLRPRLGPDGLLYFSSAGTDGIYRFTDFDNFVYEEFVPGGTGGLGFQDAGGFAWGPDGNLYVASEDSDMILRFDGDTGVPLPASGQLGAAFAGWDGPTLDRVRDVGFGPDGNVYAVTTTSPDGVHVYDGTLGAYLSSLPGDGNPPGNTVLFISSADQDSDGLDDPCDNCPEIANGDQADCDGNGTGDVCEADQSDCNANGVIDSCDIADGTSLDLNANGTPDECESYDPWEMVEPCHMPGARYAHAMIYDPNSENILLFGGYDANGSFLGDTWLWNGSDWTQAPVTGPSPRARTAMAYDSLREEVIMYGGFGTSGLLEDTWRWDGANWSLLSPASSARPRRNHTMAYDAANDRIVLFGGYAAGTGYDGETWLWNGTTWTESVQQGGPSARYTHAMAYDAARQRVVLFGGWNFYTGHQNDTWLWNGISWSQSTIQGQTPSIRQGHSMVFDEVNDRIVMFGGTVSPPSGNLNDTWFWDGVNWTMSLATGPAPRYRISMAYDAARANVMLFGGATGSGFDANNDTWQLGDPETESYEDCNENDIPDYCEVAESDCNLNGIIDACDIANGTSLDLNAEGTPDECENQPPTCLVDLSAAEEAFLQPSPGCFVVTEGETITVTFIGEDPDGGVLTASLNGLPNGATLSAIEGSSPFVVDLIWTPTASNKTGAPYTATVTFEDALGESVECGFCIEDINLRPLCNAGANQELECSNPAGELTTLHGSATDQDDDVSGLVYTWDVSDLGVILDDPNSPTPNGIFPIGITMATLTVTDGRGGVCTSDVLITVEDTTPPEVMCTTSLASLWPPNHKMKTVEVIVVGTDACTAPDSIIPVSLTVRSDEPDNAQGNGDGNTTGDVNGQDGFTAPVDITTTLVFDPGIGTDGGWVTTIQLRAERDGNGDGRSYIIDVEAVDSHNNVTTMSCVVVVPHDRRGR